MLLTCACAYSYNAWQDVFETMGQFVDGLKFSGGSHSLMPKSSIKEVSDMAHKHDVYMFVLVIGLSICFVKVPLLSISKVR